MESENLTRDYYESENMKNDNSVKENSEWVNYEKWKCQRGKLEYGNENLIHKGNWMKRENWNEPFWKKVDGKRQLSKRKLKDGNYAKCKSEKGLI